MAELNDQEKKRLGKMATFGKEPQVGILGELSDINDTLKVIADKEATEMPEIPEFPTEITVKIPGVATLVGPKGDTGDKGDPGKDGKNGNDGMDGKSGKDGLTPDMDTIIFETTKKVEEKLTPLIPEIEDIEKDLPKLGEGIRDSLELLQGDARLDVSAIKDLKEQFDTVTALANKPQTSMASIAGRDIFKTIDISAQLDGSTKTFQLSAVWVILSVSLSSFPYILRNGIDYTNDMTSITFSSQIDAPSSLAAGQTCVLTIVNA